MVTVITVKMSQSLAFLVSNAMKKMGDYNENSAFGKLQKELESAGQFENIIKIDKDG